MTPRWLPPALLLLAVLLGGALEAAWGQGAPVQGLERLSPEERAVVERNRERWERLAPPGGARGAGDHPPLQIARPPPPPREENRRILQDSRRGTERRGARRRELQQAYERWERLAPERRGRI